MTTLPVEDREGYVLRGKKGRFSGIEIRTLVIQELRSYSLVLVERVFCKVISEIKNGMATDLH